MGNFIDLTGQKFGRLIVIERASNNTEGRAMWVCKCECGKETKAVGKDLRSGNTKSCGCLNRELSMIKNQKHGLRKHPLYLVWKGIKARCYNKNTTNHKNYGGRGIEVCDEWRDDFQAFYDWATANGYEKGLTIERIDNNGNYTPENCRWATIKEQNRNQRSNRIIGYKGEKKLLIEWCEILGLNYGAIKTRLNNYGWSVERAFET